MSIQLPESALNLSERGSRALTQREIDRVTGGFDSYGEAAWHSDYWATYWSGEDLGYYADGIPSNVSPYVMFIEWGEQEPFEPGSWGVGVGRPFEDGPVYTWFFQVEGGGGGK